MNFANSPKPSPNKPPHPPAATSRDFILNRQVVLHQYRHGYRVSVDSILVGAMVDKNAKRLLDMGSGVGAVALTAAFWNREAEIHAIENNDDYFALLKKNLWQENIFLGGTARMRLHHDNINHSHIFGNEKFCQVLMNPPFDNVDDSTAPPDELKRAAFVFARHDNIAQWWRAALNLLKPAGSLVFIARPHLQKNIEDFFAAPPMSMPTPTPMPIIIQRVMAGERCIRLLVKVTKTNLTEDLATIIRAEDFILQEKTPAAMQQAMQYTPGAEKILRGKDWLPFPFLAE